MRYILFIYLLTLSLVSHAIIANPEPATIMQPDGTTVEIRLHGDEFGAITTTTDGFTLIRDNDGFLKYALVKDDALISSDIVAHEQRSRTAAEKQFLSSTPLYLQPTKMADEAAEKRLNANRAQAISLTDETPLPSNYNKFKGLVILVEFNDCKFSREDINEIFTDMITKENYDGFVSLDGTKIPYTGSVRDYFYSNSMGRFNPEFDIAGPVTIDYAQTYPCASENNHIIIPAALQAADPLVDYSLYDTDGDKVVEMVYFIFAGAGANFAGNDSHYLWPHAAQVGSSMSLDGVKFKRYACSTEFYGREKDRIIDGIGTICHEFSHVLGLNDLYDTDYSTNGLSVSPEDWSIMAGGSYLNYARTPCCYSLYERYALGFATPEKITEAGSYSLETIGKSNTGYRIDSSIPNEYFLLENRQNTGWDEYLPGHGMVVFRVDSTAVDIWEKNKVNAYAAHNYYELLRANPAYNEKGTIFDSAGDAFPGTGNITQLTNTTEPSLRSWTGLETNLIITDIAELSDGKITFSTRPDAPATLYEDFEACPTTENNQPNIQGKFCAWTLKDGARIESTENLNSGSKSVAMTMGSSIMSAVINKAIDFITVDFYNPTNYLTTMICQYSTDNGITWENITTIDKEDQIRITAKSNRHVIFKANTPADCRYRITEIIGNRISYIDNITFLINKNASSGIDQIVSDATNNLRIVMNGAELTVSSDNDEPVTIYAADGRIVGRLMPTDGYATGHLPHRGVYIVHQNSNAIKILY